MPKSDHIMVLITTKDATEAREIADTLLKSRQAACVNIIGEVDSHYWWQDRLDAAKESLLIVKSKEALLPNLIKSVKMIHSYDIPEIIAMPIVGGNTDYLEWIDSEVSQGEAR